MIQDSGDRTTFETGAVRDMHEGKGRFDLIEPELLFRLAKHYEAGAKKYDDRNWEKGVPVSSCIDSAFRHLVKYLAGWTDEDHLAAVAWNVAAIMRFEKDKRTDLLNLPWQQLNPIKEVLDNDSEPKFVNNVSRGYREGTRTTVDREEQSELILPGSATYCGGGKITGGSTGTLGTTSCGGHKECPLTNK